MSKLFNPSKTSKHIANLCNNCEELNVSLDVENARIFSNGRLGWNDRASGTFRWVLFIGENCTNIGSTQKASDFMSCKEIEVFMDGGLDIEIFTKSRQND